MTAAENYSQGVWVLFSAEFVLQATKNSQGRRVKFNLIPTVVAFYEREYYPALAF